MCGMLESEALRGGRLICAVLWCELKWMISRTFLRSASNLRTNSASCNNISALSVTWEAIQSFNSVRPNKIKLQC